MNRKFTIKLIVSLLFTGATLGANVASAMPTISIGTVVWIGYAPLYVAEHIHAFEKHGVKVKFTNFSDNATMPAAVEGGAIDGATLTYDQVLPGATKGWDLQVALPIDYSSGADAIVSTDDITRISQIKGKAIAYNAMSPSAFLLAYALQKNGMSLKDVHSVNMDPGAVPAALIGGNVKIGVTYQPSVSSIIKADGGKRFHVLFSSREAPGLITDVLVFKHRYIVSHKAEVKGIVEGYYDGLAYMKSHPKQAAAYIAEAMGIKADEVPGQLDGIHNPTPKQAWENFKRSKKIDSFYTSGQVIGGILMANGSIKKMPDLHETLYPYFVDAIAAGH
ncbi:hypothetical protein BI364_15320 [Acidihalobacter yilgarnensis]|uniref:SsuA/THI5-like domain-containing protein n=1 Tax=Acidihalobacter yilgarnensis TaxID=2819280 RepID=A0A1D8IS03_9GAMM|nr:ABC transporter substrate-binding protein [Acidihalobacter yilgarnensis]AOU99124.1 hypothetical protein BI364_15320 [Acidihalobacter yilgarnensis]